MKKPAVESPLEVSLANEKFRLRANAANRQRIEEVVEQVNRRVRALHEEGGALTIQRAALMAAFQFAYESAEVGERAGMSEEDYAAIIDRIESLISQIDEEIQGH